MMTKLAFIVLTAATLSFSAAATDAPSAVKLPDQFLIGRSIPLERAAAATSGLDGSSYYVIAPTFNGSDGNSSFVRLGNGGSAASTFRVTVLGSPTGTVYGTAVLSVAANASLQYALSQILTSAAAGALGNGDTAYALYVKDTDSNIAVQHVIYNGANGFFENVSICKYVAGANYTHLNSRLTNIHTSRLGGYPARIYVHNYAASAMTYNATVFDAATGTQIGVVPLTIGANATYSGLFTSFEQQLNWTPSSTQLHANITLQAVGTAPYAAIAGQYIFNQQLSAYVNMTQRCGL